MGQMLAIYVVFLSTLIINYQRMSHNTQDSRFKGLTDQEVLQSRQKYGVNLLTPPKTSVNLETVSGEVSGPGY